MLIKERRQHEKLLMRQAILDVAKEIAANDGWQNVTIRKICSKIKYTAPVIYQYFENKDTILQELRKESYQQIFNEFMLVDKKYHLAEKRLLEYALVWWNFAANHPELYQVMFNLQGAVCNETTKNIDTQRNLIIDYYQASFIQLNTKAKRSKPFSLELCDNLIAVIHGFITVNMVNKLKSGNENANKVFKNAILRFIHSIKD